VLDIEYAGTSVDFVPEEQRTRGVIRYETVIATLVGVCALAVSGYTAYVQRQQLRAAVWPILEFNTSNEPHIRLSLDNKGVGPAIIRHVRVTVDGQPVPNWYEALQKMLGPGGHSFSESTMTGHVLSAGESMNILVPHNDDATPLTFDKSNPLWAEMNKDRERVGVEICYCSTLGECWTLRSDAKGSSTVENGTCPGPSATTFQQ
jgi:hypothetical protein